MQVRELSIEGAWEFSPKIHPDDRGAFLEAFTHDAFVRATGRVLDLAQLNTSVSRRGVIRGIHAAHTPPGQAKYVMCIVGEILDVVVDLRPESKTFGAWEGVVLNDHSRHAVFISEGLGHAFQVLSESATVVYATNSPYDPEAEFSVNPLDPALAISWVDVGESVLSTRDAIAPGLEEVLQEIGRRRN